MVSNHQGDQMVGSNPDQVDALATLMERSAGRVDLIYSDVLRMFSQTSWSGTDAEEFRERWRRDARKRLTAASNVLREAAESAHRNADEQRRTSEASSGEFGHRGGGSSGHSPTVQRPTGLFNTINQIVDNAIPPVVKWAGHEGKEQAERMVHASPAEQLAWWNSLTPEQQAAMIVANPTLLLAMSGLPADVREKANRSAIEQMKDTITTSEASIKVEGEATIKIIKLGVDGEIIQKQFADGHYELTLHLGAKLGVGIDEGDVGGSVTLNGGVDQTYEFDSQEDVDRFLTGLMKAPLPDSGWDGLGAIGSAATGQAGGYAAKELMEYLNQHRGQLVDTTVSGSIEGDMKIGIPGAGEVSVHGGAGVEYNTTTHEKTLFLEVSGEAKGSAGPFAGAAAAEAKVELSLDKDNQLSELKLSGEYSSQQGVGMTGGPVEASSLAGTKGTFEMSVDLHDAVNRQLAAEYLKATASNDPVTAAATLLKLKDRSDIVVQTSAVMSSEMGFDAKVVSGKLTTEGTVAVATFVKPANGHFARM